MITHAAMHAYHPDPYLIVGAITFLLVIAVMLLEDPKP